MLDVWRQFRTIILEHDSKNICLKKTERQLTSFSVCHQVQHLQEEMAGAANHRCDQIIRRPAAVYGTCGTYLHANEFNSGVGLVSFQI